MDKNDPFVTAFWQKIEEAKPISKLAYQGIISTLVNTGITDVKKWLCVCVIFIKPLNSDTEAETEPILWAEDTEGREIQNAPSHLRHSTVSRNAENFIRQQEIKIRAIYALSAYGLIDQNDKLNLIFANDDVKPSHFDLKGKWNSTKNWLNLVNQYNIWRVINQPTNGYGYPATDAKMTFHSEFFFSQIRENCHYYTTLNVYAINNGLEPPTITQLLRFRVLIKVQLEAGLPTNYNDIATQIYD